MSRQSSDSSMSSDPIYSTIPRKNNNNNNLPSRNPSSVSTNSNTNSLPRHNGNASYNSGYSMQQGAMPKSASTDQLGESPRRSRKYPAPMAPTEQYQDGRGQANDSNMASQYTPGNVRNLVQNFQKSVQQNRPQTPSPGQQPSSSQPREPPVPPPRRHRPLSAGPARPNLSINVNINNTPRAQSVTPEYIPSEGVRPGSGRQLPARPDERKGQVPRPGSTPPRPTGGGGNPEDKINPNSVWYEYGCV